MADISITAANVVAGASASVEDGIAGAAITAGQVLYKDPTDKRFKLADSNSATAAARSPVSIALHAAAIGQPIRSLRHGPITIGGTLVPGVAYYLSDSPGNLCPVADVGSGEYSVFIGMATSATVLNVDFQESGVAL